MTGHRPTASARPTVLLMTSTITPAPGIPNHRQFDAAERRSEYEAAVDFYVRRMPPNVHTVLYVDNSAADLASIRDRAAAAGRPDLRFLDESYLSEVDATTGKGRCEFELVDRAVEIVRPLVGDADAIWKVTGRLQVANIDRMIATQPEASAIYGDFRHVPLIRDSLGGNDWIDLRLFSFSLPGYDRYVRGFWKRAGHVIEKDLFAHVTPRIPDDPDIVPRFRIQPQYTGTCGGSGASYESPSYRAKHALRSTLRKVAPNFWL